MSNRIYEGGRSTAGWTRGELITDPGQVQPGHVLIMVCHQFKAENLIRVVARGEGFRRPGFDYEYVAADTLERMAEHTMAASASDLVYKGAWRSEYFRAINPRPRKSRAGRLRNLPPWLSYDARRRYRLADLLTNTASGARARLMTQSEALQENTNLAKMGMIGSMTWLPANRFDSKGRLLELELAR